MQHTKGWDTTHLSASCARKFHHDFYANFKEQWRLALYLLFLNLASKQPAATLWPGHLHDQRGHEKNILYPLSDNPRMHRETFLFLPSRAAVEELRSMCYIGLKEFMCVFVGDSFLKGWCMSGCMHILLHNSVCLLCGFLCVLLHVCALL